MEKNGWVKLHRKMLDNPIIMKDAEHLAVWMYLLLNATHSEYPALFKGKKITLRPGQLITGRKSIAGVLDVSESKVTRILNAFESEQQIEQQTSNQNSLITILNWNRYQESEQQNEQQMNNKRTASEHKQECNNIYLYLLNKYSEQIKKENESKKFSIISACKNCTEYSLLTQEEQDKLFYKLMDIDKRFK